MRARLERDDRRAELLKRFLSAQEGERMRIARELHDETCQTISALSFRLESALSRAARGRGARAPRGGQGPRGPRPRRPAPRDLRPAPVRARRPRPPRRRAVVRRAPPRAARHHGEVRVRGRREPRAARRSRRPSSASSQEALLNVARHAAAEDVLVQIAAGEKTPPRRDRGRRPGIRSEERRLSRSRGAASASSACASASRSWEGR